MNTGSRRSQTLPLSPVAGGASTPAAGSHLPDEDATTCRGWCGHRRLQLGLAQRVFASLGWRRSRRSCLRRGPLLTPGNPPESDGCDDEGQGDQEIVLVAQKDAKTNEPESDDLFVVGTVGVIKQMLRIPDGTVKVLVEGRQRIKIHEFIEGPTHTSVEFEQLSAFVDVDVNSAPGPIFKPLTGIKEWM